jgi:predicted CoA-binding protein
VALPRIGGNKAGDARRLWPGVTGMGRCAQPAPLPLPHGRPYPRLMDHLSALRAILAQSSDPLNPSAERIQRLFERVRRMAVVGMSRDPAKAARRVPSYLAAKGYDVVPVNPNAERIMGRLAHPVLGDVLEPVDLVVVFRPSREAGAVIREATARTERPAIWLQEGIRADEEAREARDHGWVVVQDLCTYKAHRALYT